MEYLDKDDMAYRLGAYLLEHEIVKKWCEEAYKKVDGLPIDSCSAFVAGYISGKIEGLNFLETEER